MSHSRYRSVFPRRIPRNWPVSRQYLRQRPGCSPSNRNRPISSSAVSTAGQGLPSGKNGIVYCAVSSTGRAPFQPWSVSAALASLQASTTKNTLLRPYQVTIARPALFWYVWRFIQATASRISPSRASIAPVRTQPPKATTIFVFSYRLKTASFFSFHCNHRVHAHL